MTKSKKNIYFAKFSKIQLFHCVELFICLQSYIATKQVKFLIQGSLLFFSDPLKSKLSASSFNFPDFYIFLTSQIPEMSFK